MSANGSAAPLLLRPKLSWQPSPKDAWYYSTPLARENPFYTTFVRPWLGPPDDATFGRHDLPWSPREQALRSDPRWDVSDGRAYLDRGASAKGKARKWVFYQVGCCMLHRVALHKRVHDSRTCSRSSGVRSGRPKNLHETLKQISATAMASVSS